MPNPIRISVLMCTYGRVDCIYHLIESLEKQSCQDFEFIIVDQNPKGYLEAVIARASQKLRMTYLTSPPGLSRARNIGISKCKGDIIAFPDDDCWYSESTIEQVIALFHDHPDVGIFTGRTLDEHGIESNGKFLSRSQIINRSNVWFSGTSNAIFMRNSIVQKVGKFNEKLGVGAGTLFGAGEETDFVLRALHHQVKAVYLRELYTHHPQVNTLNDDNTAFKRAALYSRGFGHVLALNHYPMWYALFRAGRSMGTMMILACKGDKQMAKIKWIWVVGTLKGYWYDRP